MKNSFLVFTAALAAFTGAHTASAHLTYGGRDFGTLVTGAPATTISSQTVSSSFGWADATDADYGDSHRGRFFRFTLTETTTVSITASRNDVGGQTGAAGLFLPGISLYSGLGQLSPYQPGHDSSALSVSSRPGGTEGSFRSLTDWSLGDDPTYNVSGDPTSGILYPASLAYFTFIGYAVDGTSANFGSEPGIVGDGNADGYITGVFTNLAAGNYSLFVGGANYSAQSTTETGPTTFPTYGVSVSVQAIPEPSTYALGMGLAAFGVLAFRRLRR